MFTGEKLSPTPEQDSLTGQWEKCTEMAIRVQFLLNFLDIFMEQFDIFIEKVFQVIQSLDFNISYRNKMFFFLANINIFEVYMLHNIF